MSVGDKNAGQAWRRARKCTEMLLRQLDARRGITPSARRSCINKFKCISVKISRRLHLNGSSAARSDTTRKQAYSVQHKCRQLGNRSPSRDRRPFLRLISQRDGSAPCFHLFRLRASRRECSSAPRSRLHQAARRTRRSASHCEPRGALCLLPHSRLAHEPARLHSTLDRTVLFCTVTRASLDAQIPAS